MAGAIKTKNNTKSSKLPEHDHHVEAFEKLPKHLLKYSASELRDLAVKGGLLEESVTYNEFLHFVDTGISGSTVKSADQKVLQNENP